MHLHEGDVRDVYVQWPAPDVIISDGAYGVNGFPGDTNGMTGLREWYADHIAAWSEQAKPNTTLWFWGTELSWATVHPDLVRAGWVYVQTIVWDKGVGHVAGNVNGLTIRRFPVVTEVCGFYRRPETWLAKASAVSAQEWLRSEWLRAGLKLSEANAACGVKNAATRKYLTRDQLWYFPPVEVMTRLVTYANEHGLLEGRPYFSLDGVAPVTGGAWEQMRHVWHHQHGITNVWRHAQLRGEERMKLPGGGSFHLNQKPLALMERILAACSDEGDVVWEPFGGLCSATMAARKMRRRGYAAEINPRYAEVARVRLGVEETELSLAA